MRNKISRSLNKADGMDRDCSKVLPLSMDPFSSSLRTGKRWDLQKERRWFPVAGVRLGGGGRDGMELIHLM